MAFTTPKTWSTGELVTSSNFNQQIRDNLAALWTGSTAGDMEYYTSSTTKTRLPIGTADQILRVNSGGTAPEWASGASLVYNKSARYISSTPIAVTSALTNITWNTTSWQDESYIQGNGYEFLLPVGLYYIAWEGYAYDIPTGGAYAGVQFYTPSLSNYSNDRVYNYSTTAATAYMNMQCLYKVTGSSQLVKIQGFISGTGSTKNYAGMALNILRMA